MKRKRKLLLLLSTIVASSSVHSTSADISRHASDADEPAMAHSMDEIWALVRNIVVFAVLLVCFNFGLRWAHRRFGKDKEGPPRGALRLLLHCCVAQKGNRAAIAGRAGPSPRGGIDVTFASSAWKMAACACGLQVFYLTWGALQERVMTGSYGGEKFGASEFLVFSNRLAAFLVAACMIAFVDTTPARAPFRLFSLPAFSNIISSWCQYSALKFVSFPVQVVFKSNKIIPVMIMGRLIASKSYMWWEYATAAVISCGIALFMMGERTPTHATTAAGGGADTEVEDERKMAGMCLLMGYIIFDSFTSQFQGKIFKTHGISPYRMMRGINFFSMLFTVRPSFIQTASLTRPRQCRRVSVAASCCS